MTLEIVLHILILIVVSARIVYLLFKVGKSIISEKNTMGKLFVLEEVFWGLVYCSISLMMIKNFGTAKNLGSSFRLPAIVGLIGAIGFTLNSEDTPRKRRRMANIGFAYHQFYFLRAIEML